MVFKTRKRRRGYRQNQRRVHGLRKTRLVDRVRSNLRGPERKKSKESDAILKGKVGKKRGETKWAGPPPTRIEKEAPRPRPWSTRL